LAFERRDRPAAVRGLNALGRALEAAGVKPFGLEEEELLAEARRRTGLADFGDDAFREPLAIFLRALESEASLTLVGRFLARRELLTWLVNRLQLEDTWRRHPEILREEVRAPIFVTGSGRSGTSLLHELLAQDPRSRVLRTWEALHPCPPPESATEGADPRIARADREMRLWERIAPAYGTMHENGGAVPQECIYLTAHELQSDLLSGCYQVPSYQAWLARADKTRGYRYHRRVLQLLQWRCPGERWVLKAPSHLWTLRELFAVYPDARVVVTHRDPLVVMASMTSLVATLFWMRSDRVDPRALAKTWLRGVAFMLTHSLEQREKGALPEERIHDVLYHELVSDPIGELRRLYASLDLELMPDAEARMRAYLAARPKDRRGAHRYTFADTGLDLARERARFARYQQRFGVPSEIEEGAGT
jgi:hypothetical protein